MKNESIQINNSDIAPAEKASMKISLENKVEAVSAAIERLAEISSLEYDLCRKEESKKLGIKVDTLDGYVKKSIQFRIDEQMQREEDSSMFPSVQPWHEEIAVSDTLDETASIIRRYCVLDDVYVVSIALWVTFTWLHHKATVSPILNLTSPEKRCGKSTLLDVIEMLVCRPLTSGNITPAALYRSIEKWNPTLVIDEADSFLGGSDDMRGIINSGHYKSKAFVIRCDGDDNTPAQFTTWCPKVIAGIGDLAETIMDRSIIVVMKRKQVNQKVDSIRHKNEEEFGVLAQKLKRWAHDNADIFKACRPKPVEGINDRANDNWEPLLAIASLAGDEWVDKAEQAAIAISGVAVDAPSIGEQLLADILEVFANKTDGKIRSMELIDQLCIDDEKPWSSFHRGQNITAFELGKKLKPFGIKSTNIRFDGGVKKGFYQADFTDAIARYAPENTATLVTDVTNVK